MPGLLCGGDFVLVFVLIRFASVLLHLNAISIPVFFSRLVTFLICGDEKVNMAHFSFFRAVWVEWGKGRGLFSFLHHTMFKVMDKGDREMVVLGYL